MSSPAIPIFGRRPIQPMRMPTLDKEFEDVWKARLSGAPGGNALPFPSLLHGIAFALLYESARDCDDLARRGHVRLIGRTRSAAEVQHRELLFRWIRGEESVLGFADCCELWNLDVEATRKQLMARLRGQAGPTVALWKRRHD